MSNHPALPVGRARGPVVCISRDSPWRNSTRRPVLGTGQAMGYRSAQAGLAAQNCRGNGRHLQARRSQRAILECARVVFHEKSKESHLCHPFIIGNRQPARPGLSPQHGEESPGPSGFRCRGPCGSLLQECSFRRGARRPADSWLLTVSVDVPCGNVKDTRISSCLFSISSSSAPSPLS